ncbi:Secreted frizzled protein 1 [Fasciola gigantica]|uniref:Secreted frizzled protein 1 n=1 Tax=Fasciola gigantica TaxID=46835 RepID=A0A504YDT1_FASGI|nr:Secreted frizzled protein 1 [Fasciola gigantica]
MLLFVCAIFLTSLPIYQSIGPGLSHFKSRMHSENVASPASWDSSVLPYTDEANSYAYWNCHTIPPNMTLCKTVGYSRMVLPNFLQHESLREVIQQANVWVALVNTDCHPDIQRFLCSLYAPVCLKSHQEAKIPPCWELCDQVRNACLPRMRLFGFDWPEIVQCKQFPRLAESMCIPPQDNTAVKCAPCEQAVTLENIASSYCMADVVLRASIEDVSPVNNRAALHLKLSPRTRALKIILKGGTVTTSRDFRQMHRRNRQRNLRHRVLKSRIYRHLEGPRQQANKNSDYGSNDKGANQREDRHQFARFGRSASPWPYNDYNENDARNSKNQTSYWDTRRSQQQQQQQQQKQQQHHQQQQQQQQQRGRSNRRRKPRDSDLQDLDGITDLQLDCSACSSLLGRNSALGAAELSRKRWLVMGRRVVDERTKQFKNQVQVTFITEWDRSSVEFRRSMQAIRNQPVSHLCPKQQSAIASPVQKRHGSPFGPPRNLKILRSAPHELLDVPSTEPSLAKSNRNLRRKSPSPGLRENSLSSHMKGQVTENRWSNSQKTGKNLPTEIGRNNNNDSHNQASYSVKSVKQTISANMLPDNATAHQNQPSTASGTPSRLLETRMFYSRWMNRDLATDEISRLERRRRRRLERQRWRQISKDRETDTTLGTSRNDNNINNNIAVPVKPINPYGNEPSGNYAKTIWL